MKVPEQVVVYEDDAWLSVGTQRRYANVAEIGCKWGVFLPSDAQPDTLSMGIKQPRWWGFYLFIFLQEVCAVQFIYREKLCFRYWPLKKKQREDVTIIRGVTDKANWVHVSRLAQALSSMTCVLGVQPTAVGIIYNVNDNKQKKDHSGVGTSSYASRQSRTLWSLE